MSIIMKYRFSVVLMLILTLGICCFSDVYSVAAQADLTKSQLQAANVAISQAYIAVSAAQKAGANITNLQSQLNSAMTLLAQAENAYRSGDNNATLTNADSIIPITQQIIGLAQTEKETAIITTQNIFWSTIAFMVAGVLAFIATLFSVWYWFRRRYIRRLSETKPEVIMQ